MISTALSMLFGWWGSLDRREHWRSAAQSKQHRASQALDMNLARRRFLQLATGITVAPRPSHAAVALDYPTRAVHLIVGYPAGGVSDIIARLVAQWLSERLRRHFVVENRTGAAGNLAAAAVARATPDGYALLLITGADAYNTILYDNLRYSFIRDIAPVARIASIPGVMEVNPSVPAKTVPEFVAFARANPGKINMAAAGVGSGPHLYGELFKAMTGVNLATVHYRGAAFALPALVAGQVQVMFDIVVSSIGFIRSGRLRPLGVTTAARVNVLPDVPPIGDFIPGYETNGWVGVGAPAGTPAAIVNRLNTEINAALADPNFSARLAELGAEPYPSSPTEFTRFIAEFTEKWGSIIRAAGIKPK
jgi:tripartite-type tricarboxylate transporter receptor subunit TctC